MTELTQAKAIRSDARETSAYYFSCIAAMQHQWLRALMQFHFTISSAVHRCSQWLIHLLQQHDFCGTEDVKVFLEMPQC